jgi:G:T-mismatch repair DNA endonuclease (very short patch repair protein)
MARDRHNRSELFALGWRVVGVWEHETVDEAVSRIVEVLVET